MSGLRMSIFSMNLILTSRYVGAVIKNQVLMIFVLPYYGNNKIERTI